MITLEIGVKSGGLITWTNRSNYVDWESLTIIDNLTTQVNTCSFQTKRYGSRTFKPEKGNYVRIKKDENKIFEGVIVKVEESMEGAKLMNYQVECIDYTFEMDGKLVVDSWEAKTVNEIIDDIVARYILPDALKMRLRFDEGSGNTAKDDTKYDNDSNPFIGGVSWKFGEKFGNCVYLDGIDGTRIECPTDDSLNAGIGNFSVGIWVKASTLNKRTGIIKKGYPYYTGGVGWQIFWRGDLTPKIIAVNIGDGINYASLAYSIDLDDGNWHRILVKVDRDEKKMQLYIDKIFRAEADISLVGNISHPSAPLDIGPYTSESWVWEGFIDEVVFYKKSLTQSEIEDDYNDCLEFDQREVNCSQIVQYIAFNYEQVSKCFQQLAELFNYDWYIDYDKTIHFFNKTKNLAPFGLTDTNGKYIFKSLVLTNDISQLRNSIYVRGGEYYGFPYLDILTGANGTKYLFNLAYRYRNYSLKVNGVPKTVGIDNIDQSGYDAYYNYQEKTVRFAVPPPNGALIEWTGEPAIPVIIRIKDNTSIEKYGERQVKIIDNSIVTKEAARQRANAELAAYTTGIVEGKFQTCEDGLRSGQYIGIQSDIRGIDSEYIINRVVITFRSPNDCLYDVSLITTRTFGIIEFLQKLLIDKNKEIKINPDEVLDTIENVIEDVGIKEQVDKSIHSTFDESVGTAELVRNNPWGIGYIEWVFGKIVPIGDEDPRRPYAWDRDSWFN